MSCNIFKPHLHIYSEDAATHDAADGFAQSFPRRMQHQIQPFIFSGYTSVVEKVKNDAKLSSYPDRRILCVIDFDEHPDRINELKSYVAEEMRNRVYVIGSASNVEAAKKALEFQGHNDDFGRQLAAQTDGDWDNPCLHLSKDELARLLSDLRSDGICP